MTAHLDWPIHVSSGTPSLTQGYGPTTFTGEPPGFWYPDRSIDYYQSGANAIREDHLHCGLDIPAAMGTPIYAPADGTVVSAAWDPTGFGQCTVLSHPALGIRTLYGHQSRYGVTAGQTVTRGQVIGYVGSTGNSTGAHTHVSVIRESDGHFVDPMPFLTAPDGPPTAPKDVVHYGRFTAKVMSDGNPVNLFAGPSGKLNWIRALDPGTAITCSAWMHGQPKWDPTVPQWDRRWYFLSDGSGWVASSRVIGNAPHSNP